MRSGMGRGLRVMRAHRAACPLRARATMAPIMSGAGAFWPIIALPDRRRLRLSGPDRSISLATMAQEWTRLEQRQDAILRRADAVANKLFALERGLRLCHDDVFMSLPLHSPMHRALRSELLLLGITQHKFVRAPPDYYEWALEKRRQGALRGGADPGRMLAHPSPTTTRCAPASCWAAAKTSCARPLCWRMCGALARTAMCPRTAGVPARALLARWLTGTAQILLPGCAVYGEAAARNAPQCRAAPSAARRGAA